MPRSQADMDQARASHSEVDQARTGPRDGVGQIPNPSRGEVWLVAMGAARKGELGKNRPTVVVSQDGLRTGSPYDHITVVPLTASRPVKALQPRVPREAGLNRDSVAVCDFPRSFVPSRFLRRLGSVSDETLAQILDARAVIEGWDD